MPPAGTPGLRGLLLVLAALVGCGGEAPEIPLDIVMRDQQKLSGTPLRWHPDYMTLQLAGDKPRPVWWSDVLRAAPARHDGAGVFWRFDASADPVEIIEGCEEVTADGGAPGRRSAICRGLAKRGDAAIPRQTFAIAAWSLESQGGEPLLVIEPRASAGEGDGQRPEIRFMSWPPAAPAPQPGAPPPDSDPPETSDAEPGAPSVPPAVSPLTAGSWSEIYDRLKPEVENHPEDVASQLAYVQACFEIGRLDEARRRLERLLSDSPAQPEYLYWKGVLHLAQGDASRAVGLLEGIKLRVRQQLPEVYMYLGLAYAQLADQEKLCGAFREYLGIARSQEYIDVVEAKIEKHCVG